MASLTVSRLRPLLESCGYSGPLLIADFPLGTPERPTAVPLVGFAHEPADAGSSCIGVIAPEGEPATAVGQLRDLGTPVLFVVHGERLEWWAQGTAAPRCLGTLSESQLRPFFAEHRAKLAPEALYRAKTRGRFEAEHQLDFVDVGLMPLVEAEAGRKLSDLVERAVAEARAVLSPREPDAAFDKWSLEKIFWLLAAKILQDKRVHGFETLQLTAIDEVLDRVARHYGAVDRPFALRSGRVRRALETAARVFQPCASLALVTPESLASVYESCLVLKETRRALGIHSTPSFLARYVVWRLAEWIEEIPAEQRHAFDPTCGQGSFLVAAMRVLRDLLPSEVDAATRKAYLRHRLHGMDIDAFAVELARLSLTLGDVPNPDGWDLRCADVFSDSAAGELARNTMILVANPPFENFEPSQRVTLARRGFDVRAGSKATEVLRRTLPLLRPGAVFGVVVPQGLLHTASAEDLRSTLVEGYEIAEVTVLPDNVFAHSEAESALLLGRKVGRAARSRGTVRYLRVREPDRERFADSYAVSVEQRVPQERFSAAEGHSLAIPELEEVWEELRALPRLSEIAAVGKGLEYRSDRPKRTVTFAPVRFPHAKRGFVRFGRDLAIDGQPQQVWLNLDPSVIRRPGLGIQVGSPQVLVNYARVTRGPWRLKAILDPRGHAVKSNVLIVRPHDPETALVYLWSLLNSPIANAYCSTHSMKRNILRATLGALPVPRLSPAGARRVSQAAEAYLQFVRRDPDQVLVATPDPARARALLLALDAEVLRLYDLPPRLERQVLDYLSGWPRSGVPFAFDRYFPADFEPWLPLHLYLSKDFQRSTAGELRRESEPAPEVVVESLRAAVAAFEE